MTYQSCQIGRYLLSAIERIFLVFVLLYMHRKRILSPAFSHSHNLKQKNILEVLFQGCPGVYPVLDGYPGLAGSEYPEYGIAGYPVLSNIRTDAIL